MAKKSELLTSAKFAKKTGLTTATVSKLIRDGKINAAKKSGKWMIEPDQLNAKAVKAALKSGKPAAKKKSSTPKPKKAPAKAKTPAKISHADFDDIPSGMYLDSTFNPFPHEKIKNKILRS